ncbi:MAG TPA: cytochrome c peroxidase [Polyangiaceae bacterium]|nr:cytochrome c peroxidase [Polyangiaceae bacterium]
MNQRSIHTAVLVLSWAALAGCSAGADGAESSLIVSTTPAGFPKGTSTDQAPPDNALTLDRALLGKRLFYDPQLSRTYDVSCATCHQQQHAFADPNTVSVGVDGRLGTRNAPSLVNAAWGKTFFWDGRAHSLEEQAGQPIENPLEMDLALSEATARVAADPSYVEGFQKAYGDAPSAISLQKALASFVRSLVSGMSPYDRHLRGDDSDFGPARKRGEALFSSEKAECFHCHPSGTLSNEGYFNNGSYSTDGDTGREQVSGRVGDIGKFKVPGLRNIEATAPYMHDGSLATLEDVIEQYAAGGRGDPTTDPLIKPFSLSAQEKTDLLEFLRSLTDPTLLQDPRFAP